MTRKTILYLMDQDTPDNQIAQAAEAAAEQQNHLACLLIERTPADPVYLYGVTPYGGIHVPDNWGKAIADARHKQGDRVNAIETILARSNVSGDVRAALLPSSEMRNCVARSARVSDEVFIAPNLREKPDLFREAAYGVLFHSPAGLRLNGAPSQKAERVFVAWDSGTAASRAVHTAIAHLKNAKEVMIGCIDPDAATEAGGQNPGSDVAAWLSHHGCKVTLAQFPGGGRSVSDGIKTHAREFGADLVVMGAYGHARMVEAVFGGTTRFMMNQTDVPIFLAH